MINREGYRIILVTAVLCAAVCVVWFSWAVLVVGVLLTAGVVAFFRDPRRDVVRDEGAVISPCDGRVVVVEPVREGEYFGGRECIQVSVFMSVCNVHANWHPVSGDIVYTKYHPGRFLVAWHPKSSELNERMATVVDTGSGEVLFRQIAGFVARRIVSYAREGGRAEQGTRFGFIKFGSRVDLILPADSNIEVGVGDRVRGAQTVIARLK